MTAVVTWISKEFGYADWVPVQDKFEALFSRLGSPSEMMLVLEETTKGVRLYASLPDRSYAALFNNFAELRADELPTSATALVCEHSAFAKVFQFASTDFGLLPELRGAPRS